MTSNRKLLGAAAFALALAGGGAAGAILGTPSLSGAQDETDDATIDRERGAFERGPDRHRFGGEALATAAEVLGLSEDDLRTQLADGASIAEVAEEQGVDVQEVVDALVAEATARLDEIEGELPERMTDLVHREGLGAVGRHRQHLLGEGLDAAAAALDLEPDDLRGQLADGSTLAEVAEAEGVEVQVVIDALVAEATTHIDEAVADGRLDADEAEEMKADLVDRITERVNEGAPFAGRLRGGRHLR